MPSFAIRRLSEVLAVVLLVAIQPRLAADDRQARGLALFHNSIEPLLEQDCYKCHSHKAEKIKGGLVLDSRAGWAEGGDDGPAIEPGKPDDSMLYQALIYADPDLQMPPKNHKLPAVDIAKFREWIALGAPDPRVSATPSSTVRSELARKFWAYQPIRRPAAPAGKGLADNPIDAFVQVRLAAEGLHPVGEADPGTLLRRVTFDLTGLPPTEEEIAGFVADRRPDAYARVVERLLASPGFGEEWARHWLDLACYADAMDSPRIPTQAWRYRDYVVASFNRDKPLDRFLTEQIAGDLLPSASDAERRDNLIALGFLAMGPWTLAEQDKDQLKMDVVDHQISVVGHAFLGLTMECARCHDHKFDPISQRDYYALAGIFSSTETLRGRLATNQSGMMLRPLPPTAEEQAALNAATRDAPAAAVKMADARKKMDEARARDNATEDQLKMCSDGAEREKLEAQAKEAKAARMEEEHVVGQLIYEQPDKLAPVANAVCDESRPADCRVNLRGNPHDFGPVVPRGFVTVVRCAREAIPATQSGRLQLAHWLTSPEQPLTARVLANRIWSHLLGAGIVGTVDNFGVRGDAPTNPELLDYLAADLRDGWSMKALIREIVLSSTYRRASTDNPGDAERDPDNRFLWRANRRRLDAEMMRDALLAANGTLVRKLGGEALPLGILGNVIAGDLVNPTEVNADLKYPPEQLRRRALYLPIFRPEQGKVEDFLDVFDFPLPSAIAGARRATEVPTQSLYLLNSPLFKKQAKLLADRVLSEGDDESARLEHLWLRVCGHPPTADERAAASEALQTWLGAAPSPAQQEEAWARLSHALLGSSAFLFRL